MTISESKIFIEEMEAIGDVWTEEQAIRVFTDISLQDALTQRRASINSLMSIIDTALNRGGNS